MGSTCRPAHNGPCWCLCVPFPTVQPLLSLVVTTSHCFHRFDTRVALDEVAAPTLAVYNSRAGWLATVVGPSVLTYDARSGALMKEHYEVRTFTLYPPPHPLQGSAAQ